MNKNKAIKSEKKILQQKKQFKAIQNSMKKISTKAIKM